MKKLFHKLAHWFYKHTKYDLIDAIEEIKNIKSFVNNTKIGKYVKLNPPYFIFDSEIGNFTYISKNSHISYSKIGNFCSIGPNLICGWGIHPLNGVSTSPMFYSTLKQNGITLVKENKVKERLPIEIGSDVFIGANVIILDGVKIGNGAVIGAGAVVVDNIPDYAIAVGVPAKVIKFRFDKKIIEKLLEIKWWECEDLEKLKIVEKYFFDVEKFIEQWQKL